MSKAEFLLEIGVEEIPARFLPDAEAHLCELLTRQLQASDLPCDGVRAYSTPRRLTVVVDGLIDRQPDRLVEKLGPAKRVAFDDAGQPTKAAMGFAASQGVKVEELGVIVTDKGEYIGLKKTIPGKGAGELLAAALPEIILALPWPKPMRWGSLDVRFARPIHWIVALLGGAVVPFELGGVAAGNVTHGHRFHAPEAIRVHDFDDYRHRLRAAKVVLDAADRKTMIREKLAAFAVELGGKWIVDEDLLTHVAYLVEWPVPLLGRFPERYLELPREALVTPMREHQKYFSFESAAGKLLPAFCVVANLESSEPDVVVAGNRRVLLARLEDAKYFWENDRKKNLDELAGKLDGVLFHKKLGSYAEKTARVRKLVNFLGGQVAPNALDDAKRAAHIYKADLLTGMVGEFPELQGVMGMHFARLAGEKDVVARAIYEHYLPRFAGDELPSTEAGALLSICDKLDSIAACYGVGLQPTGAGDPYALRRQALGVLHILVERGWNVGLLSMIRKALDGVEDKIKADRNALEKDILGFFKDRLFHFVRGRGVKAELADAVLAVHFDRVPETMARLEAVRQFAEREEFEPFAAAFKRAGNILKDHAHPGEVNDKLLAEDAEKTLGAAIRQIKGEVDRLVKTGDVLAALVAIAGIRPQVDKFFEDVLVMHKDPAIKENRLNLLASLMGLFAAIADFRRV